MTPNQTVRAYCTECLGLKQFNRSEIENCKGDTCIGGCAFFEYRLGKRIPVKVFRKFCTECMNGQAVLIPGCPATKCKIYKYRFGKNPARIGQGDIKRIPESYRASKFARQNEEIGRGNVSAIDRQEIVSILR